MPSVIQLPSAPNTGYDALANVLLQSATQFGAQRRADTAEERRRQQRLADIESERAYADTNYSRSRGDRLTDIESERKFALDREARLREQQLADRDDARDWEHIIKTEGVEAAQTRLNQLADEEAAVAARMDARQKRLSAPEPMPTPEIIRNASLAIARQNSSNADVRAGKKAPSDAEIAAAQPQATEEARQILNSAWQRERLDAQEEQRIDSVRLSRIGSEKNTITNLFRRVGIPTSAVQAETSPAAQGKPTVAEIQKAFEKAVIPKPAPSGAPAEGAEAAPASDGYGGLIGAGSSIRDTVSGFSDKAAQTAENLLRFNYRLPAYLVGGNRLASEADAAVNRPFISARDWLQEQAARSIRESQGAGVPVIQFDETVAGPLSGPYGAPLPIPVINFDEAQGPRLGAPAPQNPGGSNLNRRGSRLQLIY